MSSKESVREAAANTVMSPVALPPVDVEAAVGAAVAADVGDASSSSSSPPHAPARTADATSVNVTRNAKGLVRNMKSPALSGYAEPFSYVSKVLHVVAREAE